MKTEWIRKTIQNFEPYFVAPIAEKNVINANENYFNVLSIPAVKQELIEALDTFKPQIYPKPMADDLRKALAEYVDLKPENIICGNGGDEMITYLLGTFLNPGDKLLVHSPTFDMYELGAETLGAQTIKVKDLAGYRRDKEGLLAAVKKYQPKITVICNPNNPTGDLLPASFIEVVLKAADNLVFVDEAYMEFAQKESVISLIRQYPNLIVLRTLSKAFGLAGMRCGYLAADQEIINAIAKIKAPYNLNAFTQLFAQIVLRHKEELFKVRDDIVEERKRLFDELVKIPGLTVYPSCTNFLLVQVESKHEEIFKALKEKDILVKIYRNSAELPNAYRISVTTKEVDDTLLEVFRKELS
ncbi:histidinol-phosphate transaminase [Dialister sp.]|uniref:histidinol-phosphate transaminase n=1 Tax=Dialister sp. TaxID=1955814 RepID=UPI003F1125BA